MGNEISVRSWEEFEREIKRIRRTHAKSSTPLLFRGQGDAEWLLKTTLERKKFKPTSVIEYYRLVRRIKPAIESLTNASWHLPTYDEIKEWAGDYDHEWEHKNELPGYSYLAHLRHQGFPSPLLDWTHSHYVAAYFAFASAVGKNIAIYVFSEMPNNMKSSSSSEPQITILGPYVKTHQRHFRQQANYTICRSFESNGWHFTPHQRVIDIGNSQQDILYKISIPSGERLKVLRHLDQFNLNGYSLFNSEENLMETLAFREMDLKELLET